MVLNKLKNYGHLVMFNHSVFSLPFGLIAMIFACGGLPDVMTFFWIFVALMAARNGANAFNRVADRFIDKKNPRTQNRDLPTGTVKLFEAVAITVFCFLVLAVAAYMLNVVCLVLLPFAIGLFIFYSYSKRFTWLCHYILGAACGGAPVGAWVAVAYRDVLPTLSNFSLLPFVLGGAVCFWVGGFDIIYATQDIDFDRKENLHSVPARFGFDMALVFARVSHIVSVLLLAGVPLFVGLNLIVYYIGIILVCGLLFVEHYNVNPKNISKMKFISYSINQIVSIVFFVFTLSAFFAAYV